MDLYTASRDIKDLIRKGVVRLTKKGGRVYRVSEPAAQMPSEIPNELQMLEPLLREKGYIKNKDIRRQLGVSRLQATRIAQRLVDQGFLDKEGQRRWTRYVPTQRAYKSLSLGYESASRASMHNETDA